jgi:hypothetical protein
MWEISKTLTEKAKSRVPTTHKGLSNNDVRRSIRTGLHNSLKALKVLDITTVEDAAMKEIHTEIKRTETVLNRADLSLGI